MTDEDPRAKTVALATQTRSVDPGSAEVPRVGSAFDPPAARYEEVGELGRGGMGRVADAYDKALVRNVAIKHMLADSPTALARFDREARITARLEHPSIVPLYDAGRNPDGTPYYVMRRVEGRPLERLVAGSSLDDRLALVPNVLAACDALAYAHARSILHRDLKPANVLIGQFGETLVIDWGLAREIGEHDVGEPERPRDGVTSAGSVAGTPGFMAPEQARGERVDARADVYALGATLFFTLSGQVPIDAPTATEMIAHVAANRAVAWARLPAGVPADLRAIVEKALAPDPERRYPDAGALAADLRRFVTGNLVAAHRYSRREQLVRFVRRHRAAVTIAAISVAVLVTGTAIAVGRIVDARDAALVQARIAERARASEAERADELTIAKARLLLDSNPTLAIATARPLATTARWRDVATIAAAARARGVAWRLAAPSPIVRLGMAPDGMHAYAITSDGKYRLYDLRTRTMQVIGERGQSAAGDVVHATMPDATRLAVFAGDTLALIDTTTRVRRDIPLAAPARRVLGDAGTVWWIDTARRAWRISRDGSMPAPLAVPEPIDDIFAGPDPGTIVLTGMRAAWLVVPGHEPLAFLAERVAAFGGDRARDDLLFVTYDGSIRALHLWRVFGVPLPGWTEIGKGFADAIVANEALVAFADRSPVRPNVPSRTWVEAHAVTRSRDGVIVSGSDDGNLRVWDGRRAYDVAHGMDALRFVAASEASPYVLAANEDELLLWDLDGFVPRTVAGVAPSPARWQRSAGRHHLLVSTLAGAASWIDLHTGARSDGPRLESGRTTLAVSPGGTRAVAVADGAAHALRLGTTELVPLATDVEYADFADERRVVLARAGGVLELLELDGGARTTLIAGGPAIQWVRAAGDHVVTGTARDTVRVVLSTRATLRAAIDARPGVHLDAAGRLWFAAGAQVTSWNPDGTQRVVATLPHAARLLLESDDAHLVIDTERGGHVVDLATGTVRPTIGLDVQELPGSPGTFVSYASGRGSGLLAVPLASGTRIIDGTTGMSWPIGRPASDHAIVALALDGSVLWERRETAVVTWPTAVPDSPAATARLVDALTNATVAPDGTLRWR